MHRLSVLSSTRYFYHRDASARRRTLVTDPVVSEHALIRIGQRRLIARPALIDVVGLTPSNHLAPQKLPHILDFERSTRAPIEQELAEVAWSCQGKAMNHTRVSDRCLLPWSSSRSTLVVAVIGLPRDLHPGFFTLLKGRV